MRRVTPVLGAEIEGVDGPDDIRIENVPDPRIEDSTDAIVRITR